VYEKEMFDEISYNLSAIKKKHNDEKYDTKEK
jgi:hypothetical protein